MIDSHAHLTASVFAGQEIEVATRAKEAGVAAVVNICTDKDSLDRGLKLAKQCPWVYNTAATTPHDVSDEIDPLLSRVEQEANARQLVAIGETGLDYYYEHAPRDRQQEALKRYLHLAQTYQLPVVIHCREAFADLFAILDEVYPPPALGVLHCFTGTVEEAFGVIDRGWYLSLSGIVTFKKSAVLRQVACSVPLDRLLIETDAPYLAPQSRRGKTNEPAYIGETAVCIANERGIEVDELTFATAANARVLFRLS